MYHKDLLNLVFLELENGHDMINFSEISRKCNQIFHQQIKIITYQTQKFLENIQGQAHGISRGWYSDGQLRYEENYIQGQSYGICRGWYDNGQLWYEHNYFHNKLHGIQRAWYKNGKLQYKYTFVHGKQIEK